MAVELKEPVSEYTFDGDCRGGDPDGEGRPVGTGRSAGI